MANPAQLTTEEVSGALAGLPRWSGDRDGLTRSISLGDFREAVAAFVRIAFVAESLDHHPDVDVRWNTLNLTLATHVSGGVTALDVDLAKKIDELFPAA